MRPDPRRHEAVTLTVREQLDFMRLIDHETNPHGRRLLDRWARPEDTHPHADRALTETLKLLWRTPPGEPGE